MRGSRELARKNLCGGATRAEPAAGKDRCRRDQELKPLIAPGTAGRFSAPKHSAFNDKAFVVVEGGRGAAALREGHSKSINTRNMLPRDCA